MPIAHLILQGFLIVMIVGLPLCFYDQWKDIFTGKPEEIKHPLPVSTIVLLSVIMLAMTFIIHLTIGTKVAEVPQDIIITSSNLKEGTAANLGNNTKVKVTVAAPRSVWASLTSESFTATVDIGSKDQGIYDLPVLVTSKVEKAKVVRVDPERVTVSIEPVIKKTVPVSVKFDGKAGNDLVPDNPTIDPEKVEISGPKSIVTDLLSATAVLKLNGETSVITSKVTLVALDPSNNTIPNITFSPTEVDVTVALIKAGKLKTVGVVPTITGQPSSGFWISSVTASPATVTITGAADVLDATKQINTNSVDVSGIAAETKKDTTLNLPNGITLAENITKITLTIKLSAASTSKLVNPEIIYTSLSNSLKVTSIDPATVSAWVVGDSQVLLNLSSGAIKLNLDLSTYKSAGTYSVKIQNNDFTLPSGITLSSFLPSSISVVLDNQ